MRPIRKLERVSAVARERIDLGFESVHLTLKCGLESPSFGSRQLSASPEVINLGSSVSTIQYRRSNSNDDAGNKGADDRGHEDVE
jgi:hypothetical protein